MAQSRKGDSKMKKWLAVIGMITCIFGLTACGSEETVSEYTTQKIEDAKQRATSQIIPFLVSVSDDSQIGILNEYTSEELAYVIGSNFSINADGYAVVSAADSFNKGMKEIGAIKEYGETSCEVDGDELILHVEVIGERKNADAEVILSNDMFMELKSAALNPTSSFGEMMKKAALNTVIGMGTVFIVLILISLIISLFGLIPKLQSKLAQKKAASESGIDHAVAQIVDREEAEDVSSDMELVAVIAAAVAAYEGSASTDGFVVRSIKRVGRERR